ncbi:MAG: putative helicase [Acidimicrobiales bacterium]|nr:putative helicase [Acidimicrobiales bacterium]
MTDDLAPPLANNHCEREAPEEDDTPNGDPVPTGLGDELAELRAALAAAQAELDRTRAAGASAGSDVVELDDERVLQEVGIYRYHHPLENADAYRDRLRELQERIKNTVKQGGAIEASEMFTFNNSLAKGRKMTSDLGKLMLRAYNAEADNCVRSLRAGNVLTAKKRLEGSVTSIAKLGSMMEMTISPQYHELRNEELELTADFLMKVQEEKEAGREERERLREERKVEQELAAEKERLAKERSHFVNALEALRANGDEIGVAELEAKVAGLDEAIAQNDYRAANIRAGYVYVISNRGAFGHDVVKIGLTRRLEPMDRVRELGDASVPFPFDVHALFFSEDAVTLENELHHAFAERRVNVVNERREFFFATPEQVRVVLAEKVGNLLEFTDDPESTQYLQSRKYWPDPAAAAASGRSA